MRRAFLGLLVASGLAVTGCAKSPPPLTEVSGVVLLDGRPLPKARVEFGPQLKEFGAQFNSTALTDDQGRFVMKTAKDESGAVVATHKVLVTEDTPDDLRDQGAQARLAQYHASLKNQNRPIPEVYGNVLQTPIEVEVKKDQKEYSISLTRRR
jgi:hypothetical protein